MFHVYILENSHGQFYIGQTDDLERRIVEHNSPETGSGKYTHKSGPWQLVYTEQFSTRADAVQRERKIKSMKSAR